MVKTFPYTIRILTTYGGKNERKYRTNHPVGFF